MSYIHKLSTNFTKTLFQVHEYCPPRLNWVSLFKPQNHTKTYKYLRKFDAASILCKPRVSFSISVLGSLTFIAKISYWDFCTVLQDFSFKNFLWFSGRQKTFCSVGMYRSILAQCFELSKISLYILCCSNMRPLSYFLGTISYENH